MFVLLPTKGLEWTFSWSSINTLTCGLNGSTQLSMYFFHKFLRRPFHFLLLLNQFCIPSFLLFVLYFLPLSTLLLFLCYLSVLFVHSQYYASFLYIIRKQSLVHSGIFLQVCLALLPLMLIQCYISFLSDFTSR